MTNNSYAPFSRTRDDWETPDDFFQDLDREFHFGLDVCATKDNAKCENFFSPKQDGLKQNWWGYGTVWCNPPFGRQVGSWVKKAVEESDRGVTTVMLLPARVDTAWFHDYCYRKENVDIRFLRGRLKFKWASYNSPFPIMIIIFKGETT